MLQDSASKKVMSTSPLPGIKSWNPNHLLWTRSILWYCYQQQKMYCGQEVKTHSWQRGTQAVCSLILTSWPPHMAFLRQRRFWPRQLLHLLHWAGNFRKHMDDRVTDKGLLAFQILTARKLGLKLEKRLAWGHRTTGRGLGCLHHPCFPNTGSHCQAINQ